MISVDEAKSLIANEKLTLRVESVPLERALGRVIAEDIIADRDYPPFNRSAMDGYAARLEDLHPHQDINLDLIDTIHAGTQSDKVIKKGTCVKIMTGAPVPEGANVVVKVEDTTQMGDTIHLHLTKVSEWMNIAQMAEDIKQGEVLASKNSICNESTLSAMAVCGKLTVMTYIPPSVTIISTGNEVVPIDTEPLPYQIRESNGHTLAAFLRSYHINSELILVKDDKEALYTSIESGLKSDILIISGGVSMGEADFVPDILDSLDVSNIFHKVRIKPGKPLWFGKHHNGTVVFGLPGNPLSCMVAYKVFIEGFLRKSFHLKSSLKLNFPLSTLRKRHSPFEEYFPCKIIEFGGENFLVALPFKGSGDIRATIGSDGLGRHPGDVTELSQGDFVEFWFW